MEPYWDGDCGLVMLVFIVVKSLSCVLLFATPWTVRGVLLASILELPFLSPGNLQIRD